MKPPFGVGNAAELVTSPSGKDIKMEKAKFIQYIPAKKKGDVPFIEYEYRGHNYTVCHYPAWETPYGETLKEQHQRYQYDIDRMLDMPKTVQTTDALNDFDFFFDYVNGNVDADGNRIAE